jgi:hypothetical protein
MFLNASGSKKQLNACVGSNSAPNVEMKNTTLFHAIY